MENNNFTKKNLQIYHDLPIKMVIYHSYVSLPTG